jgi:hypothetical protein
MIKKGALVDKTLSARPSFRGDAKHRTRNLEIPGSPFGRPGMTERYISYTAAMQSISISNSPNHCGTQTKMRAGGWCGKYRA